METHLVWKTKLFRNLYEIFENEQPAGELKSPGWKRNATGELKGKKLHFEIKGVFKKEFLILDPADNSTIGQIVFNTWKTKATITCRNQEYKWQFDNFFHTKWSISYEQGNLVKYESHFKKGEITSYTNDELLILTGLFIKDYLKQRAAAAAAAGQ
jgi:hypothetical protein